VPRAFPGNYIATTDTRRLDQYTVVNPATTDTCYTIQLTSGCGANVFAAAYLGSFDPNNLETNYLGDPGRNPDTNVPVTFSVAVPAGGTLVVVVHEMGPDSGCDGYRITITRACEPFLSSTPTNTPTNTPTYTHTATDTATAT